MDFFAGNVNDLDLRQFFITEGRKVINFIRGDHRLQGILMRIMQEVREQKAYYKRIIQGLLSEFFWVLFRDWLQDERLCLFEGTTAKKTQLIAPALSKIHKEYTEKLTVESLANVCHISKYHFCRILNK
jgi:AraC-like DNA-binding protein